MTEPKLIDLREEAAQDFRAFDKKRSKAVMDAFICSVYFGEPAPMYDEATVTLIATAFASDIRHTPHQNPMQAFDAWWAKNKYRFEPEPPDA